MSGSVEKCLFVEDAKVVTLTFISSFRSHYLRNNRGSGKKNIRCFPGCTRRGPGGHVSKGFCGNLIHVKAGGLAAEDTVLLQIRPRVTPAFPKRMRSERNLLDIKIQNTYSEIELQKWFEVPACMGQIFAPSNKGPCGGDFYFKPSSWSYGWTSNKHRHIERHVVRAYAMVRIGSSGKYRCEGMVDSSPFQISSAKRFQNSVRNGTAKEQFPEISRYLRSPVSSGLSAIAKKKRTRKSRQSKNTKGKKKQRLESPASGSNDCFQQSEIMQQSLLPLESIGSDETDFFDCSWME